MKLTPTQRKFYDLLAEGRPVSREEFRKYLWDDQGIVPNASVKMHICNLRAILRPLGLGIFVGAIDGMPHYSLVKVPNATGSPV